MTIDELGKKLKTIPGADGLYSLEGTDVPEGVTLTRNGEKWTTHITGERGDRGDFRSYDTEDEACRAMLALIEPEARRRWNFANGRGYVDDRVGRPSGADKCG